MFESFAARGYLESRSHVIAGSHKNKNKIKKKKLLCFSFTPEDSYWTHNPYTNWMYIFIAESLVTRLFHGIASLSEYRSLSAKIKCVSLQDFPKCNLIVPRNNFMSFHARMTCDSNAKIGSFIWYENPTRRAKQIGRQRDLRLTRLVKTTT